MRINSSSICRPCFCRRRSRSGSFGRRFAAAQRGRKEKYTMINWFLRRWIAKFERTWNYDASYLRDVLDADPRALLAFSKVTGIGTYRKDVPLAPYSAAAI